MARKQLQKYNKQQSIHFYLQVVHIYTTSDKFLFFFWQKPHVKTFQIFNAGHWTFNTRGWIIVNWHLNEMTHSQIDRYDVNKHGNVND